MSTLYFIDVDGTVAHNSHRQHLIQRVNPNWELFFSERMLALDTALLTALHHFDNGHFRHGEHVILTARPEFTRAATCTWLAEFGFITPKTRVICKPDCIQTQRSGTFKASVLSTMMKYDYSNYDEFVMIDDYDEVLSSIDLLSDQFRAVRAVKATSCWTDGTFP